MHWICDAFTITTIGWHLHSLPYSAKAVVCAGKIGRDGASTKLCRLEMLFTYLPCAGDPARHLHRGYISAHVSSADATENVKMASRSGTGSCSHERAAAASDLLATMFLCCLLP
jgi:hypothetical protein